MTDYAMTTEAIGAELGVTRQAIDQTLAKAQGKMRAPLVEIDADPGPDDFDPWRLAPTFAPGCRQVGCERWPGRVRDPHRPAHE